MSSCLYGDLGCAGPLRTAHAAAIDLASRRCLLSTLPGYRERQLFRDTDGAIGEAAAWIPCPSRSHLPAKVRAFVDCVRGRCA